MRNSFPRPVLLSLLSLLSLVLPAPSGHGQEAAGDGLGELFIDSVDVHLINVDVQVTDQRGRSVTGLTRDDFEVFEDGRPVAVSNFYAVVGGRVESGGIEPLQEVPGFEQAPEVPEDQKLHLVVYVDNVNIHPLNRRKSFAALRTFLLRRVGRDDRMMVMSYDRSLNERQPFTDRKELIFDVLDELDNVSGHRVNADRERAALLNDIYDADELLEVSGRVRMYADAAYNDLNFSIDALRRTVDSLAGLPGRKAILYVSDGLGMRAAEDMFYALEDRFNDPLASLQIQQFDVSRRFRQLTREASSSRVTFYTLDAAGLRTPAAADAANYQVRRGSIVDSAYVANLQEPLRYMASETGGQAIVNTNNFGPMLDRVGEDFASYYSLGYVAPQSSSGRFHEIEVKVKDRKEWKVRHRQGYRDKSIENRMSESTLAALNYGYVKNSLGVEIEFGSGTRRGDNTFLVPMVIKIPMNRLTFVPRDELQRASVRLYIAARSDEGTAPVETVAVPIDIPLAKFELARGQAYHLQHSLMMAAGRQLVAVGVRDEVSAVTSFVLSGVTAGAG